MATDGVRRWVRVALAAALITGTAACSGPDDDEGEGGSGAPDTTAPVLPEGWDGYRSDVYADDANWLCRPGMAGDVCTGEDLDATEIAADLTLTPQPFEAAADPPVDCFYVYPTVSQDGGFAADREPAENQEVWVARNQAARFTGACRVFAPVYQQVTMSGSGTPRPYFPTSIPRGALSGAVLGETMSRLGALDTAWVTMPHFVEAECAHEGDASFLAVTIGGAGDERGTEAGGQLTPDWGLHLVDVNVAMGNLVDLVASQGQAHAG